MSFDPATALINLGESVITRLFPDPQAQAEQRLKMAQIAQTGELKELELHVNLMIAQLEVNKAEAKHKSIFVAGWRPAVGWVCVLIMFFNFIGIYLLESLFIAFELDAGLPERFDMSELWPVLLGMLGIGGMRSFDKSKGTQTDAI